MNVTLLGCHKGIKHSLMHGCGTIVTVRSHKIRKFYVPVCEFDGFVKTNTKMAVPHNHKIGYSTKPHAITLVCSSYPLGFMQH